MSALKEAVLWCPRKWAPNDEDGEEPEIDWLPEGFTDPDKLTWGVHYQAKHEPNFARQGGISRTDVLFLWWKVGKWRPDHELIISSYTLGARRGTITLKNTGRMRITEIVWWTEDTSSIVRTMKLTEWGTFHCLDRCI